MAKELNLHMSLYVELKEDRDYTEEEISEIEEVVLSVLNEDLSKKDSRIKESTEICYQKYDTILQDI